MIKLLSVNSTTVIGLQLKLSIIGMRGSLTGIRLYLTDPSESKTYILHTKLLVAFASEQINDFVGKSENGPMLVQHVVTVCAYQQHF